MGRSGRLLAFGLVTHHCETSAPGAAAAQQSA